MKYADGPSFIKSSAVALLATAVDYLTMVFGVESLNLHLTLAVAIGCAFGAVTSFLLGRYWAFDSRLNTIGNQAVKYLLSNLIITLANVLFVFAITKYLNLDYKVSKIIVAIFVGVFISYPLFRNYVFKKH